MAPPCVALSLSAAACRTCALPPASLLRSPRGWAAPRASASSSTSAPSPPPPPRGRTQRLDTRLRELRRSLALPQAPPSTSTSTSTPPQQLEPWEELFDAAARAASPALAGQSPPRASADDLLVEEPRPLAGRQPVSARGAGPSFLKGRGGRSRRRLDEAAVAADAADAEAEEAEEGELGDGDSGGDDGWAEGAETSGAGDDPSAATDASDGRERAFLVGLELKSSPSSSSSSSSASSASSASSSKIRLGLAESMEELARLADTAGLAVVGRLSQRVAGFSPRTYMGAGKVEELAAAARALSVDTVIFDDELSPAQARNLEKELGGAARVCDRTSLILDIFGQRARTREGMLQVELARTEYQVGDEGR